jgi:hypothetical protein
VVRGTWYVDPAAMGNGAGWAWSGGVRSSQEPAKEGTRSGGFVIWRMDPGESVIRSEGPPENGIVAPAVWAGTGPPNSR